MLLRPALHLSALQLLMQSCHFSRYFRSCILTSLIFSALVKFRPLMCTCTRIISLSFCAFCCITGALRHIGLLTPSFVYYRIIYFCLVILLYCGTLFLIEKIIYNITRHVSFLFALLSGLQLGSG